MKRALIILSVLLSILATLLCLDKLFEEEKKLKLAELETKHKNMKDNNERIIKRHYIRLK